MDFKFIYLAVAVAFSISGCAPQIDVMSETSQKYAPISPDSVRVSTHPPQGTYKIIATFEAESMHRGESTIHFSKRLQEKAAEIGADYVLVVEQHHNHYIAPAVADTYTTENAYATAYPNADGSASATGYGTADSTSFYTPAHPYSTTVVTAKALKITSGSNQPDLDKPEAIQRD
jgi:hypothetical protein